MNVNGMLADEIVNCKNWKLVPIDCHLLAGEFWNPSVCQSLTSGIHSNTYFRNYYWSILSK